MPLTARAAAPSTEGQRVVPVPQHGERWATNFISHTFHSLAACHYAHGSKLTTSNCMPSAIEQPLTPHHTLFTLLTPHRTLLTCIRSAIAHTAPTSQAP
eukprot:360432-Chlamydomonas_euryale.AAC.8